MKKIFLLLSVMMLLSSACASNRFSLRRMVPSQYDIQTIKKVAMTPLEAHSYVDSYSASELTRRVEQKLTQSGLFQVMPALNTRDIVSGVSEGYDAYLVGDVLQWNVEKRNSSRREERDVQTDSGVQKQTVLVPLLSKKARIDFSVELIRAKDRRILGRKQYSEEKEISSEGDSIRYMTSDNDLKNEVLETTLSRFAEDMVPHEVSYSVPWLKNEELKPGIDLGKQGRWPEARQSFEGLVKSNPTNDAAVYMMGISHEAQGEYFIAQQKYEAAYRIRQDKLYQEAAQRVSLYKNDKEKLDREMSGR